VLSKTVLYLFGLRRDYQRDHAHLLFNWSAFCT